MNERPWTIYLARALSTLTDVQRSAFDAEFDKLKSALREAGFKIYEFKGFSTTHDPFDVADFDISCVEMADLVLSIHLHPSDGMGIEIGWKCANQGHVIAAGRHGDYVSNMVRGMGARNRNYTFVRFNDMLELVQIVQAHFESRTDTPEVFAPGLEKFIDPATKQPLFRQKKLPIAT